MKITVNIKFDHDESSHWTQSDDYTGSVKLTRSINKHETKSITEFLDMFKDILRLSGINENQLCYLHERLDPISDYECYDDCSGKTVGIRIDKNWREEFQLFLDNNNNDCVFDHRDEEEDEE